MDAPAMLTRKHVPENIAAEGEGGQQQMHRDEKQHKPVLKKVKDKVKKIKNTIAGHGHGNGNGHDHDHDQDTGGSNSTDEEEEDAAMREAEVEKGGYQQDVEDKPIFADSSPELHGAPMYDSERIPAAAKEVKHNDAPGVRFGDIGGPAAAHEVKRDDAAGERLGDFGGRASAKEVQRDDTQGVRLGDLGGPVVEDPAAPNSRTPMPRGGEDIGTTDVVRDFEAMTVSDDPKQVDVSKEYEAMPVSDGNGEEWNDAPTDADYTGSYTDRLKNTAAGTTEYGKKLASTVYEKVAGVGTVVASKAQQVTPGFGAGGDVGAQDGATTTATATPGVGAQDGATTRATVTPGAGGPGNGQDKGVTGVTAYIAEKLRPGDEERSLSEAITGAVQQRKEGVGSTVAKAREVPAQAVTRARGAVTSLTGGNRVSETMQPTTEGNIGEGVAAEGPVLHGEAPRTNTNVM
ncbi:unnamed protein product [Triticum turgidum subsp. durum]|uniref:Low-temperature-induced 65 kDa protein n=1 Tax=Triticum turgidum subsp. durum TaxID=4567 RepID=A0A9R0Q4W1_TRITD|nr:unnamed protein product [Triticum turgidum subsp. durum]